MASNMINNLMEQVQDQSLPTISLLQESFPNNTQFMINISTLFDPRYVFLIYAPILFAINKRVGHRMVIALTLAEWTNQILKWLLAGERPYWYVHEKAAAALAANSSMRLNLDNMANVVNDDGLGTSVTGDDLLQLKQFPVTCELGAGSPSGHSMVAATVWYVLIAAHLAGELQIFSRANYNNINLNKAKQIEQPPTTTTNTEINSSNQLTTWAKFSWSAYAIILLLIGLSRVYLACHFPHQCLAGALLGALLAKWVAEKLPMEQLKKQYFAHATWIMLAIVLAVYTGLMSTGFDPLWSVDKAMRWCAKKEYIHLDTTPFFSMTRYLGFCLGAGLAYDSMKLQSSLSSSSSHDLQQQHNPSRIQLITRRALTSLLSIGFGQFLLALPAPRSNLNIFYVISFILYTTFSYAIAGPIPNLVKRLMPASCRQQSVNDNGDFVRRTAKKVD